MLARANPFGHRLANGVAERLHPGRDWGIDGVVDATWIASGIRRLRIVLDRQLHPPGRLRALLRAAGHVFDDGLEHEQGLVDRRGDTAASDPIAVDDITRAAV